MSLKTTSYAQNLKTAYNFQYKSASPILMNFVGKPKGHLRFDVPSIPQKRTHVFLLSIKNTREFLVQFAPNVKKGFFSQCPEFEGQDSHRFIFTMFMKKF